MLDFYNQTSYKMINICKKNHSFRRACVFGSVFVGKHIFYLIKNKLIEKGDPLILAEIAGINAVKNTSNLILLCHHINVENVFFNIIMNDKNNNIEVYCVVYAHSKTGVEMEAMCGVSIALLTIYDLIKKYDPFVYINNVKLLFKDGGENGLVLGSINDIPLHLKKYFNEINFFFEKISIFLFTLSDKVNFGFYKDVAGQRLFDYFFSKKADILDKISIPDDKDIFLALLKKIVDKYSPNIIVTSGGTGLSDRDITVQVVSSLCNKIIPGFGELMRSTGFIYSNSSWLSCCMAGIYKKTLIICLPGNSSSIFENLNAIQDILLHAVEIINKK